MSSTTFILIGCSILTLIVSFIILFKLTNIKSISSPLTITLIISLFLPLSTTYLLPLDIATQSQSESSKLISQLWHINYWCTFLLTWIILPFWQYFLSSGEFTILNRIKSSLFSVLKFLLLLIIIGLLFLIYLIFYHRDILHFEYLKSLIISTSHIYSLTMAIWLMVHGLIHLPKHFFMNSYSNQLQDIYLKLPNAQLRLEDSKFELRDTCNKINLLNQLLNSNNLNNLIHDVNIRDHIIYINNKIPKDFKIDQRFRNNNNTSNNNNNNNQYIIDTIGININQIDNNYCSKLNEDLKWKTWEFEHCQTIFNELVQSAIYLEDIINYINSNDIDIDIDIEWRNFNYKWPKWMFNYYFPLMKFWIFLIFSIIGIIIIESEMLHSTKLSIMSWLINGNDISYILMILFLIIMMLCAMKSLSLVKIFNIYQVEFNSNSDPVSSIFFISYALRLTIPLGYNFLMMLNKDFISNSSFLQFVSANLKLIKLGEFLNDLIPRLVLIPVFLSIFGIWGKLRKILDGYFLFDYILDEMDLNDDYNTNNNNDIIEPLNNNDIESVIGSTNKRDSLIQAGRTITQSCVSNGSIPINDLLPTTTTTITSHYQSRFYSNIISIITFPVWSIINIFKNTGNILNSNNESSLRSYNLTTNNNLNDGIILESRRNSSISSQSGYEYDADNSILNDDYIRTIS
jgi:hypothetical protein